MLLILIDLFSLAAGLLAGVGIGILILQKRFRLTHFFILYFGLMILSSLWDVALMNDPLVTRFATGLFFGVVIKILKERAADL